MNLLDPSQYPFAAAAAFHAVETEVKNAIPLSRVEHVGASSIPGAVSKGDLDVCVIVAPAQHEQAVAALEALGYKVKVDTLRTPELCMLLSPVRDADVALQVIAEGSKFEFFMHFRDRLRADPLLVKQYNEVKWRSAGLGESGYREAKAKFIDTVLRSA